MIIFGWKLSFAWYWRNAWIGVRYSVNRRALYFNLVPFLSLRFAFGYKEMWPDDLIDAVCPPVLGDEFVRDPDNRCDKFQTKGIPEDMPDCETDGHHLCAECLLNKKLQGEEE